MRFSRSAERQTSGPPPGSTTTPAWQSRLPTASYHKLIIRLESSERWRHQVLCHHTRSPGATGVELSPEGITTLIHMPAARRCTIATKTGALRPRSAERSEVAEALIHRPTPDGCDAASSGWHAECGCQYHGAVVQRGRVQGIRPRRAGDVGGRIPWWDSYPSPGLRRNFAGMNIEGTVKLGYRKEFTVIDDSEARTEPAALEALGSAARPCLQTETHVIPSLGWRCRARCLG